MSHLPPCTFTWSDPDHPAAVEHQCKLLAGHDPEISHHCGSCPAEASPFPWTTSAPPDEEPRMSLCGTQFGFFENRWECDQPVGHRGPHRNQVTSMTGDNPRPEHTLDDCRAAVARADVPDLSRLADALNGLGSALTDVARLHVEHQTRQLNAFADGMRQIAALMREHGDGGGDE